MTAAPWPRMCARPGAATRRLVCALAIGHSGGRAAPAQLFEQNCAARKQCNRPLADRDPAIHAVPEAQASKAPKGHLKPLGHPDFDDSWAGEIDQVEDMDPETFWTKYWPRKPFLLKGFAKRSAAFTRWKDDAYLKDNFGTFKAKTEPKNEDRLTDYCGQVKFGSKIKCGRDIIPYTETHMKVGKFLPKYRDGTFDKYIITQMPDVMGQDFVVPTFHSCAWRDPADPGPQAENGGGRWMTQMYENNLWISNNEGNTFATSVIHYDMNHQIMCLFDGRKEWIMWDMSTEGDKIPMWSDLYSSKTHSASGSDDSPIDGERVDLMRWPKFGKAKWNNASMEAGDCLYTPALLLHYVRSFGRNVAGMTMFQQEERYDPACGGKDGQKGAPGEPQNLSSYDVLWSFPEEDRALLGWNVVKMGYPNWKRRFLRPLASLAKSSADGKLSRKAFTDYVGKMAKRATREGMKGIKKRLRAVFTEMDEDGDGAIDAERLYTSRGLRFLLKDICVWEEGGRGDFEEDVEVHRYDMKGSVEKNKLEL